MSDYQREDMSKEEYKDTYLTLPQDLPEPSEHWQDISDAVNQVRTVAELVLRGNRLMLNGEKDKALHMYVQAVEYADHLAGELESMLGGIA